MIVLVLLLFNNAALRSAAATQISANARAMFRKHTERELNAIVDVIESSIAERGHVSATEDGSAVRR